MSQTPWSPWFLRKYFSVVRVKNGRALYPAFYLILVKGIQSSLFPTVPVFTTPPEALYQPSVGVMLVQR